MRITLDVPDELAASLIREGQEPARAALEAWGLEAYRERRISAYQLRLFLGFESRWDLDGFLKEHKIDTYTVEEFEKDLAVIEQSGAKTDLQRPA